MLPLYLPSGRCGSGYRNAAGRRFCLLHHVIIVIPRLKEYEMGSLADYIAMLALAQMESLDACQPLPSIVNVSRDVQQKRMR